MPYAIDLFCGAGGCSEGLLQAGFHILFSSDISEMAEVTYRNRHEQLGLLQGENTWFERADVKELSGEKIKSSIAGLKMFDGKTIPEIDLMIGGPSCQGFSRAGRRDSSDPRNMLFREYVRIINEMKPKYVVLENVEGFKDMQFFGYVGLNGTKYDDGSVTPDLLTNELTEIGYEVLPYRILNAADYGVPQRRNRIIFIGYRKGLRAPSYPKPTHTPENYVTVKDAIADLSKKVQESESDYAESSKAGRTPNMNGFTIKADKIENTETSASNETVTERFSLFRDGETGTQLRKRLLSEGVDVSGCPNLLELCGKKTGKPKEIIEEAIKSGNADAETADVLLTKKHMRTKLSPYEPSPTIMTCADDYVNPWENRPLTVREMARLQSFDDSFVFLGKRTTGGSRRRFEIPQQTQVGNAVPPLLAKAVAEEIKKVL